MEDTAENVWGIQPYNPETDKDLPTVFFGLYHAGDFQRLYEHRGKKWILWAGSDIRNFVNGYAFSDGKFGDLSKRFPGIIWMFKEWLNQNCESWTENETEADALRKAGVQVGLMNVCPSFLGDVKKFPVVFRRGNNVFTTGPAGREEEYGFTIVERLAERCPDINFHLYVKGDWRPAVERQNLILHIDTPWEQMNKEIKDFQVALRLNAFDGFSEIVAKAVLQGQYAIGKVKHPHVPSFTDEDDLVKKLVKLVGKTRANMKVRSWYIQHLNSYPWNLKKK